MFKKSFNLSILQIARRQRQKKTDWKFRCRIISNPYNTHRFDISKSGNQLKELTMKRLTLVFLAAVLFLSSTISIAAEQPARQRQLLDLGWKFTTGVQTDANTENFNDSSWQTVDLPHDWSIGGKLDPNAPMNGAGGFFPAGEGWYRLNFDAPADWLGKQVTIEFEGVYMNSDVWLNGVHLGFHPYGYTTFVYDLTPHLKLGQKNVLAVRVDNSKQVNSRWFSGSGIYRHVWLNVTNPVHVAQWGVFITTPEVAEDKATVRIQTTIRNDTDSNQSCQILNNSAKSQIEVPAKGQASVTQVITVASPELWSPESPNLHQMTTRIFLDGKLTDEVKTPFGIRSIKVSAENGFQLNGKTIKLCGGCIHHDNGCLGAAAFDRAEIRKVELLKAAGFNAIRSAHNPPSEALLDACDKLGMLVIDESFDCWEKGKNTFDYSRVFKQWWQRDLDAMVLRDRNHPSVVIWSVGNEVVERDVPDGNRICKMLTDRLRTLDTTRPITAANCWATQPRKWADMDGMFSHLDIAGYNYTLDNDKADHNRVPSRVMLATESFPSATYEYWRRVSGNSFIIGDFVWSAVDYLGESGIGRFYPSTQRILDAGKKDQYPYHGAYCGDLDLTGLRKAISHYRNILWDRGEKLYMTVLEPAPDGKPFKMGQWALPPSLASWTWPGHEGNDLKVEVYSSYDKVRLYLNDKLLDEKATSRDVRFRATFTVPYAPGTLKAVAIQGDKEVANFTLTTASEPANIRLTPDRPEIKADGQDLSFVTVEILDKQGRLQPNAENMINFSVSGPASIVGLDNGDLNNDDPYQGNQRKAFHGRALVVLRATRTPGDIILTARSDGLPDTTVTIHSRKN